MTETGSGDWIWLLAFFTLLAVVAIAGLQLYRVRRRRRLARDGTGPNREPGVEPAPRSGEGS